MKIAVVNLTSGGFSGGYVKYLRTLLPRLRDDARVARLRVFMPPGVTLPGLEDIDSASWRGRAGSSSTGALKDELRRFGADVVFIPTARWFDAGIPTAVMVRNMEPLTVPFHANPLREALRNRARAYAARRACRNADRVIAVSDHVRRFLTAAWSISPSKIGVVYHGVDPVPDNVAERRPDALVAIDAPFIFTAGSIRPARGLVDLIRAMVPLGQSAPSLRLVVGGRPDAATAAHARHLIALARTLGVDRSIVWAGQLSESEMAWCFRRCEAFVMTSLAEACPNIALEALSFGCELISTSTAPMPEFFEDAATYYAAAQPDQLAARILEMAAVPAEVRSAHRQCALTRARQFDWQRTADATISELQRVVGL